ncbi:lytic polysaccharide monooxygenase [Streptomyces sp. NPDC005728]|uniref:lytic polysaccharide monooxygenase auxiliary activity family 9 protein n=1 Tax=Streptomyces sp. NPDC005728 TaxID=3157054 RepID=UPI0033D0BA43
MRKLRTIAACALLLTPLVLTGGSASAHGSSEDPPSRSLACKELGVVNGGGGRSSNAACNAAYQESKDAPFSDWMSVAQIDVAGRHRAYVPDGKLCSGNNPKFSGLDLARDDWPAQELPSGSEQTLLFKETARHAPSYFEYYVTKDGYDPAKPLAWDDLEAIPFLVAAQPALDTTASWAVRLPTKKGRHIIFAIWQRELPSSGEAFYSCSDVDFS